MMFCSLLLLTATATALQGPHVVTRHASTSLNMAVMNRGLEQTREGATPQGAVLCCTVFDDGLSLPFTAAAA